jgi:hypothetical protein
VKRSDKTGRFPLLQVGALHHGTNMELGAWMSPVPHKIAKAIIYFPVCARTRMKSCLFVSFSMATYMVTNMVLMMDRCHLYMGADIENNYR